MEQHTFPDAAASLYVRVDHLPGEGRCVTDLRLLDEFGTAFRIKLIGQRWKIRTMAEAMIAALDAEPGTQPLVFPLEAGPHGS